MDLRELDRKTALHDYENSLIGCLQNERTYIQKKTFTRWINSCFAEGEKNGDPAGKDRLEVKDLFSDLSDGKVLLQLLEALSGEAIGQPNSGHLRVNKLVNVNRALDFLHRNVRLQSIGAEDIVDGNEVLIMGLVWNLILHFRLKNIGTQLAKNVDSRTSPSPQEALLHWCQRQTDGYSGVDIQNFSGSWRNGLGFNALIHAHRPELIQYYSLRLDDSIGNLNNAFKVAREHLRVPMMLDAEDVNIDTPDERSIITYVASLHHALNRGYLNDQTYDNNPDISKPTEEEQDKWETIYEEHHIGLASTSTFGLTSTVENAQRKRIPTPNLLAGFTNEAIDNHQTNCSSSSQIAPEIKPAVMPPKSNIPQSSVPVTHHQVDERRRNDPGTTDYSTSDVQYEGQFLDEYGRWIPFGKPRSDSNGANATPKRFESTPITRAPEPVQRNENTFVVDGTEPLELTEEEYNFIMLRCTSQQPDPAPTLTAKPLYEINGDNSNPPQKTNAQHVSNTKMTSFNSSIATMHSSQVNTTPPVVTSAPRTTSTIKPAVITQEPMHSQTSTPHRLSMSTTSSQTAPKIRPAVIPSKSNISPSFVPMMHHRIVERPRSGQGTTDSPLFGPQYEWQFLDKRGIWIRNVKPNSVGNGSNATNVSSDNTGRNYYHLFQKITENNIKTLSQRSIRPRIESAIPISSATTTGTYYWFFQDENNGWIKYGEANDKKRACFATTTSSADIERHYRENPTKPMIISSAKFSYILDFATMTQTNTTTYSVRPISRRSVSVASTENHFSPSTLVPENVLNTIISGKNLETVLLDVSQLQYKETVLHIKQTLPKCNVQNLVHVRNTYLWKAYENRKEFLRESYPEILFKEEWLFHGTNSCNVKAICKENLDWRLHGISTGNKFGRGTYFSNNARLSAHYCGKESPRVMFVVRVLIGRFTRGDENTVKPPKDGSGLPYDTTVDDVNSPSIFVKYDSNEYYPQYYFEFT